MTTGSLLPSLRRSHSAPEQSLTPESDEAMRAHLEAAVAEASEFADEQLFCDFTTAHGESSRSMMPHTVSPDELSYTHDDFTIPNTNSFTNLTTPSLADDESPYLDSLDTSPAFGTSDFSGSFGPLFPSEDSFLVPPPPKRSDTVDTEVANGHEMSRTSSNQSRSDQPSRHELLRHRLSQTAGISKPSRRASRNLPPIEVNDGDELAVKRAKNTMAARKSRQKKKDEVVALEAKLIELMDERDYWKMLAVKHGAPMPDSPTPSAMSPTL